MGLWLDSPDDTPYSLPSLRNLSLVSVDVYAETDEQPLFSPVVLPALAKLKLEMVLFNNAEYNPRLESIAGQLEYLDIDIHSDTSRRAMLKVCDRLISFSYSGGSPLSSTALDFGTPVRFLQLAYYPERTDSLDRATLDLEAAYRSGLIDLETKINLPWGRLETPARLIEALTETYQPQESNFRMQMGEEATENRFSNHED